MHPYPNGMNFFQNIISPLDQFEIRSLLSTHAPVIGNMSLSITNIALYLTIGGYLIVMTSVLSTINNKLVANGWPSYQEWIDATLRVIFISALAICVFNLWLEVFFQNYTLSPMYLINDPSLHISEQQALRQTYTDLNLYLLGELNNVYRSEATISGFLRQAPINYHSVAYNLIIRSVHMRNVSITRQAMQYTEDLMDG